LRFWSARNPHGILSSSSNSNLQGFYGKPNFFNIRKYILVLLDLLPFLFVREPIRDEA
jgi:hypothetical protein